MTTFKTTIKLVDANGSEVVNNGFPISVSLGYQLTDCNGFNSLVRYTFTIPNGQSKYDNYYYRTQYVDCGQGSCNPEYLELNCVGTITGQALPLYSASPINNRC